MSLDKHTLSDLLAEKNNGLKLYAETAWGWSELKVAPFLRQVAGRKSLRGETSVLAITEIRNDGGVTLKLPRRI